MIKRVFFLIMVILLCLSSSSSNAYYNTRIWVDREIIQYGESFNLCWSRDPSDPDWYPQYSMNIFEENNRLHSIDNIHIDSNALQGSHEVTPKVGGTLFMWFHTGGDYSIFPVKVLDAPNEGNFRSTITLDKSSAMPGEILTAEVSLSDGRLPLGQTLFTWRVRDTSGELRDIFHETGRVSSITVPSGIQGEIEAQTTDSAGRIALTKKSFGIGSGIPLSVSLKLDTTKVRLNDPITASWTITGGDAPYTAEADWYITAGSDGLGFGYYGDIQDGPGFSTFRPWEAGYASVYITVWDAKGREFETNTESFIITDEYGNKVQPDFNTNYIPPPAN